MNTYVVTPSKTSNTLLKKIMRYRVLYLLFIPVLLYYIIFRYAPIVLATIFSLKDFRIGDGILGSPWIGLDNFKYLFSDPEIVKVIKNTVEISLMRLAFGFFPPIILSILLFDVVFQKYKKLCQTLIYIPHFLSWVIVYGLIFAFFSTGSGFVNAVISGLGFGKIDFLISQNWFRPILIGSGIWKELGWGTIIYLASLSTIDLGMIEAAIIDGAGPIRRIMHITLPNILPVISFVLCISLGSILFAGGEQVLMFYNNAVYDVADIIDTWVYREGLSGFQYSLGTAVNLFQSLIGMVMVLGSNYFAKKYTGNGIW